MPATFDHLPIVSTRKEFMDTLQNIMSAEPSVEEFEEEEEERRGRPRELKTYVLETNDGLSQSFSTERISGSLRPTGLDDLKILNLSSAVKSASFYVDVRDSRFWILHTGALSSESHHLVRLLAHAAEFQFDRAWIPTQMLERITRSAGNKFDGFGLDYYDFFVPEGAMDVPIEEVTMNVSGTLANEYLRAVRSREAIQRSVSYNKVRIKRGDGRGFAKDDVTLWGNFSVKEGKSIDDHISLVEGVRSEYRQAVEHVEKLRLMAGSQEGTTRFAGKAFNLTFDRPLPDLGFFVERLVSGTDPFRLWGIKTKIDKDYYHVNALDLHSGQPLDMEVTQGLIRVYLPEQTCGNVLLRLYVNLQHNFDSRTGCQELYA